MWKPFAIHFGHHGKVASDHSPSSLWYHLLERQGQALQLAELVEGHDRVLLARDESTNEFLGHIQGLGLGYDGAHIPVIGSGLWLFG